MQVRIGVDMVEVSRVRRLLEEHPSAETEIFTEAELAYCAGKTQRHVHLAARFAAKEAVLKALGTGLGPGMRWTDVGIDTDPVGCPHVRLRGAADRRVRSLSGRVDVSMTHTGAFAVANAVLLVSRESRAAPTSSEEASRCAST